jgi:hypothetical protein
MHVQVYHSQAKETKDNEKILEASRENDSIYVLMYVTMFEDHRLGI